MLSSKATVKWIEERIKLHIDALDDLPKCSKQDTWNGRRCERYCEASEFCDQYKGLEARLLLTEAKQHLKRKKAK